MPTALNIEQRKLYNTTVTYYANKISLTRPIQPQLLLNINREARTRKMFILLKVCTRIQEMARVARKGNPVF